MSAHPLTPVPGQPGFPRSPERLLARHAEPATRSTSAGRPRSTRSMQIVPGGIVEQFRQAFSNVLTTLAEAGGVPEDLVSITIYLTDIPDYQAHGREIGRAWRELAGTGHPAMAGIGTTALWQPEALDRDRRRRGHPGRAAPASACDEVVRRPPRGGGAGRRKVLGCPWSPTHERPGSRSGGRPGSR